MTPIFSGEAAPFLPSPQASPPLVFVPTVRRCNDREAPNTNRPFLLLIHAVPGEKLEPAAPPIETTPYKKLPKTQCEALLLEARDRQCMLRRSAHTLFGPPCIIRWSSRLPRPPPRPPAPTGTPSAHPGTTVHPPPPFSPPPPDPGRSLRLNLRHPEHPPSSPDPGGGGLLCSTCSGALPPRTLVLWHSGLTHVTSSCCCCCRRPEGMGDKRRPVQEPLQQKPDVRGLLPQPGGLPV